MIAAAPDWKHRALHLGALWAFAIGKPLLDSINESGFFLLPRSAAPVDIVLLGVLALFAAPALLLGIEQLAGLASDRARDGLHLTIVFFLAAVLLVQIVGSIGVRDPKLSLPLSLSLAAVLTWAYARTTFVPTTLDVLSPAPVLFLALFLFASPSSGLWLPGSEPGAIAEVTPAEDPPIVIVVLDEFPTTSLLDPKGEIDGSLFPGFAELGRRSTWYENATTVADQTERAIPAIVTGRRQDGAYDGMPLAREHPESLFTLLASSYDIDAVETVTQLCPRAICERQTRDGFGERFGRIAGDLVLYTPAAVLPTRVHDNLFGRGSNISPLPPRDPRELFDLFLDGLDLEPGRLDFIHTGNLPHKPWTAVPELQSYTDPAEVDVGLEHEDDAEARQVEIDDRKRHLLQVGAADRLIARTIAEIDSQDAWEESLVVVVADHGISFRPRTGRRRAGKPNLDQIAFVPLFVKLPGQLKGRTDPGPVQTIDVVPTIARALGVEVPWELDGLPAGERADLGVDVTNYRGTVIGSNLPRLLRRRERFVAQQSKTFETGRGWNALIESGPGSRLVGRPLPAPVGDSEGSAEVILSGREPGQVDAVVAGRLRGVELGRRIAVAVNGRIAAVTRAVAAPEGIVRYQAVLPPRVYEGEVESVQVLLVERGGGGFELLGEG